MKHRIKNAQLRWLGQLVFCCLPLLYLMCDRFDPAVTSSGEKYASAQITIHTGNVATLAKRQTIDLNRLVLTLTSMGEDTIRDSVSLSGTGGSSVELNFYDLKAPRQWKADAVTYDHCDSVIHHGTQTFFTNPADTAEVTLDLNSKYSMLRISFNDIPDSAQEILVFVDGVQMADSVLEVSDMPDSVVLGFDYLSASVEGIAHAISLRIKGRYLGKETVLFTADTVIDAKSGESKVHNITCKWTGPIKNDPPVFDTIKSVMLDSVYAGNDYLDTLYGYDSDGDRLTYSLITKPASMSIDDSIIMWTPGITDTGTHDVIAKVSDNMGGSDTLSWIIDVKAAPDGNQAPEFITVSADMLSSIKVDSLYVDTVHATDADGDQITYSFIESASGMQIQDSIIIWTPTGEDVGNKSISILVRDIYGSSDTLTWNIDVEPNSQTPIYPVIPFDSVINGEIYPSTDMDQYQFQGTAGDRITLRVCPKSNVYTRIQLVSPTDSVLINQNGKYGSLNYIDGYLLPATGRFIIRVMETNGNRTFNYEIALYSIKYARANSITVNLGANLTDTIYPGTKINSYLFNGIAANQITLRLNPESNVYTRIQIVSPTDSLLINQNGGYGDLNSIEDFVLPETGQYIIIVMEQGGDDVFEYNLGLF